MRCAEPSFLLAGAVLWRVRRRGDNAENRSSSSKNRPDDGSRTSCAYDLWCLSLLGATWCRIWSTRRTSERSWPLPAHKLDRSWPPGPTPIERLRSTWVPRPTPKHPLCRLGLISGQLSSFLAIWPGIEIPCRARLAIGPGRSGQVSSFPAALSSPTIRLAKKKRLTYRRACIARSAAMCLHRLGHTSSLVN